VVIFQAFTDHLDCQVSVSVSPPLNLPSNSSSTPTSNSLEQHALLNVPTPIHSAQPLRRRQYGHHHYPRIPQSPLTRVTWSLRLFSPPTPSTQSDPIPPHTTPNRPDTTLPTFEVQPILLAVDIPCGPANPVLVCPSTQINPSIQTRMPSPRSQPSLKCLPGHESPHSDLQPRPRHVIHVCTATTHKKFSLLSTAGRPQSRQPPVTAWETRV
jgi:hypothetical protein